MGATPYSPASHDFHAIATAHNLLSALIDNALHHGTTDLDPRLVAWRRVVDINDRTLRQIVVALTCDIMRMPGLPRIPSARRIDISDDGVITGLS